MKCAGKTRQAKAELAFDHVHELVREGDGMDEVALQRQSWQSLLNDAGPRDHIVQLYQDQKFLNRAVCRFAGGALANGEAVILVPTLAHWDAFRPRLAAEGVDVKAAQASGQLSIVDADQLLPEFMRDGMPDAPIFLGLASDVIARARGGGRYARVRWWGEMVNLLWERGDVAASMNLEDEFDRLAREQDIAIFCSFVMDNFNSEVHTRMLPRLGQNHSHLIPVEDYARLERAVTDALCETVGSDEARILEEQLLGRVPAPFQMPRSQALLLALRESLPAVADSVLARSRTYYNPPTEQAG
jgi:MEDS: MEthanogen/methylotroph, DcmR Sensory domain